MVGEKKFKKLIWFGLSTFLIITIALGYYLKDIRFDYDFEKFFPSHDEETSFFFDYRNEFQSDNDFLLISIERESGVFNKNFLEKIDNFSTQLSKVKHVTSVRSITSEEEIFIFPTGSTSSKPYIDFNDFDAKRDSSRIYKNSELINTFIAENGKAVCLFIKHEDYLSKKKSDQLIVDIDKLKGKLKIKEVRIAGRAVGQAYYINKMIFELSLFMGLSVFLIILFLYIAFKSIWGILIPQVVILSSMIWVVGGMGLFDQPVNIILTVLPSIMFVVCMSNVIHLVSKYLDALREEPDTYKAIKTAVKEVGFASFLTSLTTSIGFFSLYFVSVQPIQIFGVILGFGVLIAFLLTFLTLPILFYIFPGPKHIRNNPKNHFWKRFLEKSFLFVMKKQKGIIVTSIIVILISAFGILQMGTNSYMMDDMKESEQMKQDFDFFDDNFGGIRPFELSIQLKNKDAKVWDKEVIQSIDSVETYLEKEFGVTVKISLVKLMKTLNRASHAGNKDEYKLPNSNGKIRTFKRVLKLADKGRFIRSVVDSTERKTRINGTISDLGSDIVNDRSEKFKRYIKQHKLDDDIDFRITGTAYLLDKNMSYLAMSLFKGLGLSILLVALIIGFVHRSGRILIISVIVNVLPLLVIAGYMGYTGVQLRTSTSIIFTIAFGIAVDDTIHFLGKFKYELMKGKGKMYALKRSYLTTGKAMILTTLILSSGFLLLMFSSFLGTFYMGLLLCITFVVALIADLLLLPVLLLIFYKVKPKSTKD